VVPGSHAQVARAWEALKATVPRLALLAGSGASSFAVYRSQEDAHRSLEGLPRVAGVRFLLTRTLSDLPGPAVAATPARPRG
jgi:4-diphosphocytidyl-2C-methyl-D-erythritol kinase